MKKLAIGLALAALLAMGCEETTEEASKETAAASQAAQTAKEGSNPNSTGIAECDAYLSKLEKCGQMPKTSIERMRQGYRAAASNQLMRSQVASTCSQGAGALVCTKQAAAAQPAAAAPAAPAGGTFGAIATSDGTTVFGLSLNQPSQAAAQQAAKSKCGRSDCKVGETFPAGHCVVVSTIDVNNKVGVAWGNEPTMQAAIQALIGLCGKHKLPCPVVASGCSDGQGGPKLIGGGTVFTKPPPIKQFKPKPRPRPKRDCQRDSDCPRGTKCVVYRCPGCNKCEAPGGGAGPKILKLGEVCGGGDGYCGSGLTCNNTTLRCVRE